MPPPEGFKWSKTLTIPMKWTHTKFIHGNDACLLLASDGLQQGKTAFMLKYDKKIGELAKIHKFNSYSSIAAAATQNNLYVLTKSRIENTNQKYYHENFEQLAPKRHHGLQSSSPSIHQGCKSKR